MAFNSCNPHIDDLLPIRAKYFENNEAWQGPDLALLWQAQFRGERARWPSPTMCPGFRAAMTEWYDACTATSTCVLGLLALSLGLPEASIPDPEPASHPNVELHTNPNTASTPNPLLAQ